MGRRGGGRSRERPLRPPVRAEGGGHGGRGGGGRRGFCQSKGERGGASVSRACGGRRQRCDGREAGAGRVERGSEEGKGTNGFCGVRAAGQTGVRSAHERLSRGWGREGRGGDGKTRGGEEAGAGEGIHGVWKGVCGEWGKGAGSSAVHRRGVLRSLRWAEEGCLGLWGGRVSVSSAIPGLGALLSSHRQGGGRASECKSMRQHGDAPERPPSQWGMHAPWKMVE